MKGSRNIGNYFRRTAQHRRILSLFSVGIVTVVVISGVATAQNSNVSSPVPAKAGTAADDKAIRPFKFNASEGGTRGYAQTHRGDTVAQ